MSSFRFHPEDPRSHSRQKQALVGLVALCVVFALALVSLVALYRFNALSLTGMTAAQDDQAIIEVEESDEPHIQSASTQVIKLISLMGLDLAQAQARIGHGASLQSPEGHLGGMDFSNEAVLLLTAEAGDSASGTPTVRLGLNDEGIVTGASYSAPMDLLGYGELPFADAVSTFHVVEHVLSRVGLMVPTGSVELPAADEYSSYDWDGKTLTRELYTFTGTAASGDATYVWEVTLDYDYSQANAESDLSYTVKRLEVAIRPVAA